MASRLLLGRSAQLLTRNGRRSFGSLPADADHGAICKNWKLYSMILTTPALIATYVIAYKMEYEHVDHRVRPDFKEYAHLRVRSKPFPWGDGTHTAFHHTYQNAIPNVGYESDEKPSH